MSSYVSYINDFQVYINYLIANKNQYIICAAVADTLFGISQKDLAIFKTLGMENMPSDWSGYVFLMDGGNKVIDESSANKFPISKSVKIDNISFRLISKPFQCGNRANILINNINFSSDKRGINIVVFDKGENAVIDSVSFDFFPKTNRKFFRMQYLTKFTINKACLDESNPERYEYSLDKIIKKYSLDANYKNFSSFCLAKKVILDVSRSWNTEYNIACVCIGGNKDKVFLDKFYFMSHIDKTMRYNVDFYNIIPRKVTSKIYEFDINSYGFDKIDGVNWRSYDRIYIISNNLANYLGMYFRKHQIEYLNLYDVFREYGITNIHPCNEYYNFINDKRDSIFFTINEITSPFFYEYYEQKTLYNLYKDNLRNQFARNCFFLSLTMKNFLLAKEWYEVLIKEDPEQNIDINQAWEDIKILLDAIKNDLKKRSGEDIYCIWIDHTTYEELDFLPYISTLKNNSICFDNIFSCTGYTSETFLGIFTGKKLLNDRTYSISKINPLNSILLNDLKDYKINIHTGIFSNYLQYENICETSFYENLCTSELLWRGLLDVVESKSKCFVFLPIEQTHPPYFSTDLDDKSINETRTRKIYAYKETDKQIEFYLNLFNGNIKTFLFSDHGGAAQGNRHHVFLLIYGKSISHKRVESLCSTLDFYKYIRQIVAKNEIDENDIAKNYITIQGMHTLNQNMQQSIGTILNIATPAFYPPFYAYTGVITLDYMYIYFSNGREYFTSRHSTYIPMSWYYRDDDICDRDLLSTFKNKYISSPPSETNFGPRSKYIENMERIIEKNYIYNYKKVSAINELIETTNNTDIYLYKFEKPSIEFFFALFPINRMKIKHIVLENDEKMPVNIYNFKSIKYLKLDDVVGDNITIINTYKNKKISFKNENIKTINIYDFFELKHINVSTNFYDFEVYV